MNLLEFKSLKKVGDFRTAIELCYPNINEAPAILNKAYRQLLDYNREEILDNPTVISVIEKYLVVNG